MQLEHKVAVAAFIINIILSHGGFEIFSNLSCRHGQIPPYIMRNKEWKGKRFLYWDDFYCQQYGDGLFFSVMDACFAWGLCQMLWSEALLSSLKWTPFYGFIITEFWVWSVKKQFREGKFNRWDWGFGPPDGKLTYAGWYHLFYFWIQSSIIWFMATQLLWIPTVFWALKTIMVLSLIGYGITVAYDAKITVMSLGVTVTKPK